MDIVLNEESQKTQVSFLYANVSEEEAHFLSQSQSISDAGREEIRIDEWDENSGDEMEMEIKDSGRWIEEEDDLEEERGEEEVLDDEYHGEVKDDGDIASSLRSQTKDDRPKFECTVHIACMKETIFLS
jgi:hypothetical protein